MEAQVYYPLTDSDAVWIQTVTYGDAGIEFTKGYHLFLSGDTTVQSKKFMKLWAKPVFAFTIIFNGGITGVNISSDSELLGGLYEDSSKRVWFKLLTGNSGGGFGCNNSLFSDSTY